MKPGSLLQLRKGKLLDTFSGFVDFFNWMARFLFRLRSRGSIQSTKDADDTYYLDIKGFPEADENTVPTKNADGAIEWKKHLQPDDQSIWELNGKLGLYAFYDADVDSVPVKNSDGVIEWKPYGGGGGSVEVDDVSITKSESGYTDKLAVKGHTSAQEHQVFSKGASAPSWAFPTIQANGSSDGTSQRASQLRIIAGTNTNLTSTVSKSGNVLSIALTIKYV